MPRGGYVKAWRSMHDNPVLRGDAAASLLFRFYIEAVAHEPTPWDVAGEIIELAPGQWFGPISRVQEVTGLTRKQVRRADEKLAKAGMIEVRPRANRGRMITVLNYGTYQGNGNEQGQPRADRGPTEGPTKGPTEGPLKEEGRRKKEEERPSVELKARRVIEWWNEKFDRQFQPKGRSLKSTAQRIREGATGEDMALVVKVWTRKWASDPEMSSYLQPTTLFNTKFWDRLATAKENPNAGPPRRQGSREEVQGAGVQAYRYAGKQPWEIEMERAQQQDGDT